MPQLPVKLNFGNREQKEDQANDILGMAQLHIKTNSGYRSRGGPSKWVDNHL